jgi:hypothetical protein
MEDATGKPPFPFFGRSRGAVRRLVRIAAQAARLSRGSRGPLGFGRGRAGTYPRPLTAGVGFAGLGGGGGAGAGGSAAGVVLRAFGSGLLGARGRAA